MSWLCIRVNTTQQEILKLGNQQIYNNNDIQLISNNCKNKKILIRNLQKKVMEKIPICFFHQWDVDSEAKEEVDRLLLRS